MEDINNTNGTFKLAEIIVIISTSNFDDLFDKVLKIINDYVPFSKYMICLRYDRDGADIGFHFTSDNIEQKYIQNYTEEYAQEDLIHRFLNITDPTIVRESDETSESLLIESDYMKYWLQPLGLYHTVYMIIGDKNVNYGSISLYRSIGEKDFSDNELKILKEINKLIGQRLNALIYHS